MLKVNVLSASGVTSVIMQSPARQTAIPAESKSLE